VPGANAHITAEQATASVAQIDSLDVVVGQCEIPMEATISAFQAAKARSAMTVLNPAPAIDLPGSFLSLVDWLVPNEHEFEMMFDSKPTPKNIAKAASQLFADRLSDSHRSASDSFGMVVTLGDKGAALWSSSAGEVEFAAAERTDAVDTTGAGDAFVGAFAVGLASGLRPNQAALAGCLCATDSVKRLGAQESFPDYEFAKQAFSAAMSV
jgi:ribokinase